MRRNSNSRRQKSERPPRPAPIRLSSKGQLLLDLLEEFKFYHPGFVVKAIWWMHCMAAAGS